MDVLPIVLGACLAIAGCKSHSMVVVQPDAGTGGTGPMTGGPPDSDGLTTDTPPDFGGVSGGTG